MAIAALNIDGSDPVHRLGYDGTTPIAPLRCIVMDDSRFDRKFLRSIAQDSRFDLDFVETSNIAETVEFLETDVADLALLDYRVPDGDGIDFARKLTSEGGASGMPIIVVTGDGSEAAAVRALRSGAVDYLNKNDVTTESFDAAIENALTRVARGDLPAAPGVDTVLDENRALRRIAIRNMRLLKGQTIPLLAFAGAAAANLTDAEDPEGEKSRRLSKIARNVVGLVDDTVIHAATYRVGEADEAVDLKSLVLDLVRDEAGEVHASHAHVDVGNLPVIIARRSQMTMLFEELLLNGIRACAAGRVPEISVKSARDPEGNPIVVFEEKSAALSIRKQNLKDQFDDLSTPETDARNDPHTWSLCQRLVEKNSGQFRIAQKDADRIRVMMRFPKHMIA